MNIITIEIPTKNISNHMKLYKYTQKFKNEYNICRFYFWKYIVI